MIRPGVRQMGSLVCCSVIDGVLIRRYATRNIEVLMLPLLAPLQSGDTSVAVLVMAGLVGEVDGIGSGATDRVGVKLMV